MFRKYQVRKFGNDYDVVYNDDENGIVRGSPTTYPTHAEALAVADAYEVKGVPFSELERWSIVDVM